MELTPTGWIFIPEYTLANGKRPDGALRDNFTMLRGYWEAKDTRDDLEVEVRKKLAAGYPTDNIIFEDTTHAHLYQNGRLVQIFDLADSKALADLLTAFFSYAAPQIESFERAVGEFRERIPDLALGLKQLIGKEHAENPVFSKAFAGSTPCASPRLITISSPIRSMTCSCSICSRSGSFARCSIIPISRAAM
jgi:hypothetical protein